MPTCRTFDVPMRDGVLLATDVYLPELWARDRHPELPVILERTPYDKSGVSRSEKTLADPAPRTRREVAKYFASHGYAVVMQDCRGRYESGGVFEKYVDEAEDGFDTLAWIVDQTWCNGRVGTMGFSYGAHTQCALAALNPPGLTCMFIDSGGFSNAFHGGVRQGGAFEMKQATWAFRHAMRSRKTATDPGRRKALESQDIAAWMRKLDWVPGNSPLSAAPEYEDYFFDQWRRGLFDDYWKQPGLNAERYYDSFPDVPVAVVGSWYDPYVRACTSNFLGLRERHASPVRLIMGPWTHGDRSQSFAGDVDFGPSAVLDKNVADDYFAMRLAWFEVHLKETRNGANGFDCPVRYFCMGGGEGLHDKSGKLKHGGSWRSASTWPPETGQSLTLYFHDSGLLSADAPESGDSAARYEFDPRNPVPTIGGAITSGSPVMEGGAFDQVQTSETFSPREVDRDMALGERPDVLVFRSEPLTDELTVAGPVVAELWVSTDCRDTDFTMKLIDEYPAGPGLPGGYAMNLTDGIFRLRFRDGWEREVFADKSDVYVVRIEAFDTCNRFAKGHRIRVDISSSNYPHYDVNPNTGRPLGDMSRTVVASNTVYFNRHQPSRVFLNVTG